MLCVLHTGFQTVCFALWHTEGETDWSDVDWRFLQNQNDIRVFLAYCRLYLVCILHAAFWLNQCVLQVSKVVLNAAFVTEMFYTA